MIEREGEGVSFLLYSRQGCPLMTVFSSAPVVGALKGQSLQTLKFLH